VGVGAGTRPSPEVLVTRDRLLHDEVVVLHGIACTTQERAVFDAMRLAPDDREAVVAFDMAAAAEVTSLLLMRRYLAERPGRPGVARVRSALAHTSERSRSPNETRLRLAWELDAGIPRPLVNWPVLDRSGKLLATVDLLDVDAGMVGEFDGAEHRSGARHTRDVRREHAVRRVKLEYVKITGRDLSERDLLIDRILETRDRALWSRPEERLWRPGEVENDLDERVARRRLTAEQAAAYADWKPPDVSQW